MRVAGSRDFSDDISRAAETFLVGIWYRYAVMTKVHGVSPKEIVIAVFLNGLTEPPEVLRYSAAVRGAKEAHLTLESLDDDPKDEIGDLPGFRRSRRCQGLNLSDDRIDSAHIYWNHDAKRFNDWVR